MVACRRVGRVYCFQSPSATVDYRPTYFVTIDDYVGRKLKVIDAFGSQAGIRDYLEPELITATARYWARYGAAPTPSPSRRPGTAAASRPPGRRRHVAGTPDDGAPRPAARRLAGRPLRVLVTGAGGPAAIAAMKSLRADPSVELLAADMDPWAAGLYLVPPGRGRWSRPGPPRTSPTSCWPGAARSAWTSCCRPSTPSCGRWPAPGRRSRRPASTCCSRRRPALDVILDKLALAERCAGGRARPADRAVRGLRRPGGWTYPVIVKPRTGSGSRGVMHGGLRRGAGRARALAWPDRAGVPARRGVLDRRARRRRRARDRVRAAAAGPGRLRRVGGRPHRPRPRAVDRSAGPSPRRPASPTSPTSSASATRAGVPALLEVNPRMPGTLGLTIASGVDMPRLALAALLGQPVPRVDGLPRAGRGPLPRRARHRPGRHRSVGLDRPGPRREPPVRHWPCRSTRTSTCTPRSPTGPARWRRTCAPPGSGACARCAWSTTSGGTPPGCPSSPPPWRAYRGQPGLRVLAGVEAKILDTSGRLDLPPGLDGIDLVLIADHQFPGGRRPGAPGPRCGRPSAAAAMTPAEAIERLCEATRERAGRDGPRAAARPPVQRAAQDRARRGHGARAAARPAGRAGRRRGGDGRDQREVGLPVGPHGRRHGAGRRPLVAGSDSHHCRDVGVYRSVGLTVGAGSPA